MIFSYDPSASLSQHYLCALAIPIHPFTVLFCWCVFPHCIFLFLYLHFITFHSFLCRCFLRLPYASVARWDFLIWHPSCSHILRSFCSIKTYFSNSVIAHFSFEVQFLWTFSVFGLPVRTSLVNRSNGVPFWRNGQHYTVFSDTFWRVSSTHFQKQNLKLLRTSQMIFG